MTTYALALVALIIAGTLAPYVVRLVSRMLDRLPILGAVAALGALSILQPTLADGGQSERVDSPETYTELAAPERVPWEDNTELQARTSDEDMVDAYRSERSRFTSEIDAAAAQIKQLLGL